MAIYACSAGVNMTPTNKLRFVERAVPSTGANYPIKTFRILQQWWENNMTINLGWTGDMPIGLAKGEWRDVPVEIEA
jgi:hypothetical protein